MRNVNYCKEKKPREIVKELISQYIHAKPIRISLRLYCEDKHSIISIKGDNLNQTIEHSQTIDFTSFAYGVLEAYREAYGELEVVPISFREEIYRNDKVSLDLYPTGGAGIFDIFIEYKQGQKNKR
jgi:hypothetical protein